MKSFLYEDNFFSDLSSFVDYLDFNEEQIQELPEDYTIKVQATQLEAMFELDADYILDFISNSHYDRFTEEGHESDIILDALNECIDFKKLNSKIPKLYYPINKFYSITKKDLLELI